MLLLSRQDFVRVHCSRSLISSNQRVLLIDELACSVHPIIFQSNDYGSSSIITFPFDHQNNDVSILTFEWIAVCLLELYIRVASFESNNYCFQDGFYTNNLDFVGLYVDADDDYKVLHIKRRCGVLGVYVYSREVDSWRNIPFITRE
ncbi:hypothetical protein HanXRQr2_Chr17g0808691 [Helianthus annuus]|uniref:Uncharacterized protein n=1 Tax=Helianthus annuus TaxID=4232 RepID=A0A9K3DII7_HELAN|nr:hypothetical protein HanXRQr2_Chr17g0808691 [Helianthus annuus]